MRRIAVMGWGDQTAPANLIGNMLERAAGWRVEVLDRGSDPERSFSRLEAAGCDCAILPVTGTAGLKNIQVGVLTGLPRRGDPEQLRQFGRLVLNLDDESCRQLAAGKDLRHFTYSERRDQADLTAKNLRLFSDRVEFEALTWDEIRRVRLPAEKGCDLYHSLAALGCGLTLGLRLEEMVPLMEHVSPLPKAGMSGQTRYQR